MTAIGAITDARNNAELVLAARSLGYLGEDWTILDPTYGYGKFWTLWQPKYLVACDLDPAKSPQERGGVDFRDLPFDAGHFDAVVLDGPYKLNGTSTGEGPSASDEAFGVHEPATMEERHQLIKDGITEAHRVLGRKGFLLVKCQDQVCSGAKRWQTRIFPEHAESVGFVHVDNLHLRGGRKQPETTKCKACSGSGTTDVNDGVRWEPCNYCEGVGSKPRPQKHAWQNFSTLSVFRKK